MDKQPVILFINSHEPDYLQDICYSGLAETLGSERIIDLPWNPHFHVKARLYPRNLGLYSGSTISSIKQRFKKSQYDAVIVGSAKPLCLEAYFKIVKKIPAPIPVIFIDGGDWPEIGGDLKRLKAWDLYQEVIKTRPFDIIFKREYLETVEYPGNVYPLPFGFNYHRLPVNISEAPLKYQVSFWAVESNPLRTKALDILQNKFDCRENGTVRKQVFSKYHRKGKKYLEELAACRIVINMPGVGWDTLRYWEVPAVGRLLISPRPKIVIPDNFIDRQEIVFCRDDLSDLLDLCSYYLEHESEREIIAKAGAVKARLKHSNISRARQIIDIIGKTIK